MINPYLLKNKALPTNRSD